MYYHIIRNDLLRNKLVSLTIILFIILATTLMSLVAILTINLVGSITTLTKQAEIPDFLQMHEGEINKERLQSFATVHENVEKFQILEFLNIPGAKIHLGEHSLTANVQDNGLSVQSTEFDYLLDEQGRPIHPAEGELYVPIGYITEGTAQIGDKAKVGEKEFQIAGSLKDGQMNSPLASSKRFLVHEKDYQDLASEGSLEYLIEFQLKDTSKTNAFETAYTDAGLEANGPTLTKKLFKLVNGLSDGVLIAMILLVGFLIVIISLMCIRFTLLTKLEEDYREIGTMKAIGLRLKDIKNIYLAKYTFLAVAGCLTGVILSIIFSYPLLQNIRLNMGESSYEKWDTFFAFMTGGIVYLFIVSYILFVLKRFKKISAATAIRNGESKIKKGRKDYFFLSKSKILPVNVFLGIKNILFNKKFYLTLFMIITLACFMVIVPWSTYHTVKAPSFTKYLGFGDMNLMISMDHPGKKRELNKIQSFLNESDNTKKSAQITAKSFKAKKDDKSEEKIIIELGEHDAFPIEYMKGNKPKKSNEIALSSMNAHEFKKEVGDTIEINTEGGFRNFIVSGIYSNILNGGKTAKANFSDEAAPTIWTNYYIQLNDTNQVTSTVEDMSQRFPFAKVIDANQYKQQTLGMTMQSVKKAANIAFIVALFITGLVSLLFMKLLVVKDSRDSATLKSIGFTNRDIAMQYVIRGVFILTAGMLTGSLLANTLGETIVALIFTFVGIEEFVFISHPFIYAGFPILMLLVTLLAVKLGTRKVRKITIMEHIKE